MLKTIRGLMLFYAMYATCPAADPASPGGYAAAGWPQLQCNPQRTGYTPVCPEPPYRVLWQWSPAPDDAFGSIAQPVASPDAVFLPTLRGMLHAFANQDGSRLWSARVGQGCFHSAACENGRVFAASMDGYVAAFDAKTGGELWRMRGPGIAGFVVAPLLAEGKIFLGDMDGNMIAVEQADGRTAWSCDVGSPIIQSPAYNAPSTGSGQAGRVYVGAQDMRMRALDAGTGEIIWTSGQLSGMSMEPYHPVVFNGYVIVRTMLLSCDVWVGIDHFIELDYDAPLEEWEKFLTDRPERQDMFVLDEKTGREAFKIPHQQTRRRSGSPVPPPCVDGDGRLVVPIYADVGKGWKQGTWGRLDLEERMIEKIGAKIEPDDVKKGMFGVAGGNSDETNLFSAGGRIVFFGHDIESQQGEFQGYYDLDSKRWRFMGIGSPQGRKWGGNEPGAWRGLRGQTASHHAFAITDKRLYRHVYGVLAAWGSVGEGE